MNICLFDPGIENNQGNPSANLGDLIIQEAVERELYSLFPNTELIHVSTHTIPNDRLISLAKNCSLTFVGGTNLLNSNMSENRQWKLSLKQQILVNHSILRSILFGVGWGIGWGYNVTNPNLKAKLFLKTILSSKFIHSVRDNYTKDRLKATGISNVLNTGCPTMWPFIEWNRDYPVIPSNKSENVLAMFTDYAINPELDGNLLNLLAGKYEKIFIWPQGRNDKKYIFELAANLQVPIIMLEHSLESFNDFLASGISFDYIGTRLHGGIKCLLSKKRSLIIEIDNRATEIARDTNLPTVSRSDFLSIQSWIEKPYSFQIKMNYEAISQWKMQFLNINSNNYK